MKSIPFSLKKVYEGFAETQGIVRYEDEIIWLEFQTKDSFIGLIKSDVQEVSLPANDLETVVAKHKMFRSDLTLRARSLQALEQFPNRKGAEVVLQFKRQYRDDVKELTSALLLAISEAKLTRLEDKGHWDE